MIKSLSAVTMDNTINSDLIRGHIDTIILKSLYEGDRYGYDIIKEIEQKSGGQYQLKQPTLYSCLKRLETQGFISSYWGAKSNGGRRKYYALTDMGRELFIHNQTEWEYSRTVIDKLISDKPFDLREAVPAADGAEREADGGIITDIGEDDEEADADEERALSETDESEDKPDESEDGAEKNDETDPAQAADTAADDEAAPFAADTAVAGTEEPDTQEPIDSGDYFRRLFGEKLNEAEKDSYSEKLYNETVEPSPKLEADSFFKDFTDEYTEDDDEAPADAVTQTVSAPQPEPKPEPADDGGYGDAVVYRSDPEEPVADDKETEFIRYDTPVESDSERDIVMRREYRNILNDMLTPPAQTSLTETDAETAPADAADSAAPSPAPEKTEPQPADPVKAGKFERLASDVKDLGDGIRIRTHNSAVAKSYAAENYYYANKLMLYHYAILFGLCLFEIIVMFLAMNVGFGVRQTAGNVRVDLLLYALAVVISLAFPITAAILNYLQPDRRKRCDFNLKNSLIFRCSLTIILLVLTYLINVCCGMKTTSAEGYVPSLVIPMVMSFNFIFSTLIFNLLYTSKKFAAED